MIRSKEHRRIAMFDEPNLEGLAMVSNKMNVSHSRQQGRNDSHPRQQSRESLWCLYCKKPKHNRETCFKLHGKEAVLSKMGGFRNLQPKNQAQAHLTIKELEGTVEKTDLAASFELGELNAEQISNLKSFMKLIQNGSWSLEQTSTCLNFEFFIGSQTVKNGLWILDSRAINHMTRIQMFLKPINQ